MLSLKSTIDNTSNITKNLAKITSNIQSGEGIFGRLINDKSWGANFDSTLTNMKEGSSGFKTFIDKTNELDAILISIKATMENTSNMTGDLSKITSSIESGQGTIGRLLMDPTASQNLDSTFINLKEVSGSLKELIEKAKDSWLLWGF